MKAHARQGLAALDALASQDRLTVMGAFHARPEDGLGEGTLVLLGPAEPGFWDHVTREPEFTDGDPDPLDRWSARVIGAIAAGTGGRAYFPFGDPHRPFIAWAIRSGRAWRSPVTLLVHDRAGLLVSYRGAILLPDALDLPPAGTSPCDTCTERPCLSACPASALSGTGYDIVGCHDYLDTGPGRACMSRGCAVRNACPAGRGYARLAAQSAFHMERFHP